MRAIVAALALMLGAVSVAGWLVRRDIALDIVTPEPARVVRSFVGALAARRPASAEQHLAGRAREPRAISRLHEVAAHGHALRLEDATTLRSGDTSQVRARLRTPDGTEERDFQLVRDPESRVWRITAFDLPR